MTSGQLRDWVTLSDSVDDGSPVEFSPSRVAGAILESPPGSFDEQKNSMSIWIHFHRQVTTNTRVDWYDHRRQQDRVATVRGFRDVIENGIVWLELFCEEVRTP